MRVLLNPSAGSADDEAFADLRATASEIGAEIVEVETPDDTRAAVARAVADGIDTVVAAGGDGTVCLTTDALMKAADSADTRPALGILPLGTGNDFARTLALPLGDPAEALRVLDRAPARRLDVIRVSYEDTVRYALNVCNGGFAGALGDYMTEELKSRWGPFAYVVGAMQAMPQMEPYHALVAWDDGPEEAVACYNFVVANGRTAGGGKPVAPMANPEDGLLDVVVVRAGGALDVARLALGTLTGDALADDDVVFNRVARVHVRATPPLPFNVDGEDCTDAPVTFEAVPGALRVRVGPDYEATPEPPASGPAAVLAQPQNDP